MPIPARELRVNQTEAEKRLWYKLRNRQIAGAKFRRQAKTGPHVADFVCFERKVVIEIDGGQHSDTEDYDARRAAWLNSEGFVVLRFWNNEVLQNTDGVLARIAEALLHPSPRPSPTRGGGDELAGANEERMGPP